MSIHPVVISLIRNGGDRSKPDSVQCDVLSEAELPNSKSPAQIGLSERGYLSTEIMQNSNKPITRLPHPYCTLSPEDVEYARYLDRTHGRMVAKNYLRTVIDPDYLSTERLAAVKRTEKSLERAAFKQKVPCPPEGWKFAIRKHIRQVGRETLAATPDIQLKDLERAITKSYCYGSKTDHPYKVWREELKAYLSQIRFERTGQQSTRGRRV